MADTKAVKRNTASGGHYLPVVPDGWHYQVAIYGPDGAVVTLHPRVDVGVTPTGASPHVVDVSYGGRHGSKDTDGMHAAIQAGVEAAKGVQRARAAAAAAQEVLDLYVGSAPGGDPWDGDERRGDDPQGDKAP